MRNQWTRVCVFGMRVPDVRDCRRRDRQTHTHTQTHGERVFAVALSVPSMISCHLPRSLESASLPCQTCDEGLSVSSEMHRHRLSHSCRTRSSRPCPSHRPPPCRSRRSGRQKLPRPSSAPHFASVQAKSGSGVNPPSGLSFCRHDHCTTHTKSPLPRPASPCLLRVPSGHHRALARVADAFKPPLVVHAACTEQEKIPWLQRPVACEARTKNLLAGGQSSAHGA